MSDEGLKPRPSGRGVVTETIRVRVPRGVHVHVTVSAPDFPPPAVIQTEPWLDAIRRRVAAEIARRGRVAFWLDAVETAAIALLLAAVSLGGTAFVLMHP